MNGCDYVLSVASPVFMTIPKHENEAMRTAKEGITRILKAARNVGVKRVVTTSNFGAVGLSIKILIKQQQRQIGQTPMKKAYRLMKNRNY